MDPWTPLLISHTLAASIALPLGAYQLWRHPRGDAHHVLVGRVWGVLMLYVAVSSFGITGLNGSSWSLLHVLSGVTIVSVVAGVWAIRRGNVQAHLGSMRGAWLGLLGAFIFAVVVPARHIPQLAMHDPVAFARSVMLVLVTAALVIAAGHLAGRAPRVAVRRAVDCPEPRVRLLCEGPTLRS